MLNLLSKVSSAGRRQTKRNFKMAFQIGNKVQADVDGTPFTGTIESFGKNVVWVKSDSLPYPMPFDPSDLIKL
jgi:hypothetical protein